MKKLYAGLLAVVLCGTISIAQQAELDQDELSVAKGFFTGLVKRRITIRNLNEQLSSSKKRANKPTIKYTLMQAANDRNNYDPLFKSLSSIGSNNPTFPIQDTKEDRGLKKKRCSGCAVSDSRSIAAHNFRIIIEILSFHPENLEEAFKSITKHGPQLNNLDYFFPVVGAVIGAKKLENKQLAELAGLASETKKNLFNQKLDEFCKILKTNYPN